MVQMNLDMGGDPEFFIEKNGKIVPAEIIERKYPEIFVRTQKNRYGLKRYQTHLIKDGIALEMNFIPSFCREIVAGRVYSGFEKLSPLLRDGYKVSKKSYIKIPKRYMESLNFDSLNFGCKPSNNVYIGNNLRPEENPFNFPYRSAGGHIHFGFTNATQIQQQALTERKNLLIKGLDVVVGNTAVLIDKDIINKERRKVYGKAGEYRDTSYGIEYRTLSNFWLWSESLMSLIFGLAREVVYMVADDNENLINELLKLVDQDRVREAIDTNNVEMAYHNYNQIKDYLIEHAERQTKKDWKNICNHLIPELKERDFKKLHKNPLSCYTWNMSKGAERWANTVAKADTQEQRDEEIKVD